MLALEVGAYRPQLRRFKVGDYVYLQREAPTTLDVKAGRTILRVKDILPSGVLLLEGKGWTRVQGQHKELRTLSLAY